jgi:hypothetical protein
MKTKNILLAIIIVVVLGLIISYALKSPKVQYENDGANSAQVELTEDTVQAEIATVIDQENIFDQDLEELEASFN